MIEAYGPERLYSEHFGRREGRVHRENNAFLVVGKDFSQWLSEAHSSSNRGRVGLTHRQST